MDNGIDLRLPTLISFRLAKQTRLFGLDTAKAIRAGYNISNFEAYTNCFILPQPMDRKLSNFPHNAYRAKI